MVNVGWLSVSHPYAHGEVEVEIVIKLARICREGVKRTRGFHVCELCPPQPFDAPPTPTIVRLDHSEYAVGGAEIRVVSSSGKVFAAPDMIVHYVTAHEYRPPDEFLDAVNKTKNS